MFEVSEIQQNPEGVQPNKDIKISELKAVYKLAIATRNFEIQQLINRNNFFMLFQGVLLAAVFNNQASKPYVEFIICFAGIFISWHQMQVAAGAKYWQEWWELKTSDIEQELKSSLGDDEFISLFYLNKKESESHRNEVIKKVEKTEGVIETFCNDIIKKKYSVSRVPIRTGLVLMLTWILLFLSTINFEVIWALLPDFCIQIPNLIDGHYFTPDPPPKQ